MKVFTDCFGQSVRLTDERRAHILDHPEMRHLEPQIASVIEEPEFVRRSRSDPTVRLSYRYYAKTFFGGKWLCVVVKYAYADAFVVTAYLTDRLKPGEDLWPTK